MMVWLESRPFAIAIAESSWLFPIFESLHVLALAIVVGSVAIMDLRLLNVANRNRPVGELISSTLPWTWSAFAVTVVAGFLLFASKAAYYFDNGPFRLKMILLALAGVNMLVFHFATGRDMASWDRGAPPLRARIAGALSLTFWVTIVAAGRWIGFT